MQTVRGIGGIPATEKVGAKKGNRMNLRYRYWRWRNRKTLARRFAQTERIVK